MTALFDSLSLLAAVAPLVSVRTLAYVAALCLAWPAWLDHDGATS